LREQLERVQAAVEDIRASGDLPALVICHGGSLRVMLCRSDPRGLRAFHSFEVPNVAVVEL
jgi:broad specificity phosphatase PhoE